MKKGNLFDWESEACDDDRGEEEKENGDPEGGGPRQRHG